MKDEEKEKMEQLNDVIFDPDLSVEELEERLELSDTWVCLNVNCGLNCPSWA